MKYIFLLSLFFLIEVSAVSKQTNRVFVFKIYNDLIDTVDVKWIDFAGETRTATALKSKQTYTFDSFFEHDWLLQSGSIKRYFTIGEGLFKNDGVTVRVSQLNAIKPGNPEPKTTGYSGKKQTTFNGGTGDQGKQGMTYSDDSSCNSQFQAEMLNQHNIARSKHGAPQMRLSDELNRNAVQTAENSARFGSLTQSNNRNNIGENLGALLGGGNLKRCADMAIQVFNMWYKGEESYDYNAARFSTSSGLFTQVVWAASTQLGCGVACKNTYCYMVCNYRDHGNVVGQFSTNVFRPIY